MKKIFSFTTLLLASTAWVAAQQAPIRGTISQAAQKSNIAIPDFRGSGGAAQFMAVLNQTM